MNDCLRKKVNILMIATIFLAPLHMVFAAAGLVVDRSPACHMNDQAGALVMATAAEHSSAMSYSDNPSCHSDAHCCLAIFSAQAAVIVPASQSSFIYGLSMADCFVPLVTKPPQLKED